jgi:hypothetical protein
MRPLRYFSDEPNLSPFLKSSTMFANRPRVKDGATTMSRQSSSQYPSRQHHRNFERLVPFRVFDFLAVAVHSCEPRGNSITPNLGIGTVFRFWSFKHAQYCSGVRDADFGQLQLE